MSAKDMRRVLERALAKARSRGGEARTSRCLSVEVDGVACLATCKARVSARGARSSALIEGECLVYLSCRETDTLVSGFGWVRFGIGERSAPRAAFFIEWAMGDARDELARHPEFLALRERALLGAQTPPGEARARPRAKSL